MLFSRTFRDLIYNFWINIHKVMDFLKFQLILPFLFLSNNGNLICPNNLNRALTDRNFSPEHFDILIAFFWVMVQKIWNFKVWIHILPLLTFSEKTDFYWNLFAPGAELASPADRWVPGTRQRPRWRDSPPPVWPRGGADRRGDAATTGGRRTETTTEGIGLDLRGATVAPQDRKSVV